MRLVKVQDGLIEQDNYFLTSSHADFLGDNQYSRTSDTFTLKEGYIERPFNYQDFVIIVEKQQQVMNSEDEIVFYIRKDNLKSGLIEKATINLPSSKYWKLVRHKEFVQGYCSNNGVEWESVGGGGIMPLQDIQGFSVSRSTTDLVIKDYKVYSQPYVKFIGLMHGQVGALLDDDGNIIDEKNVNSQGELDIFLQNTVNAKLVVYEDNTKTTTVFESELMFFQYGDIFNLVNHDLKLYYKGTAVSEKPTLLNSLIDVVTLKNLSLTNSYNNILVTRKVESTDVITLSLDNVNFSEEVIISEIPPNNEADIYIKIEKDRSKPSFKRREFDLIIDVA